MIPICAKATSVPTRTVCSSAARVSDAAEPPLQHLTLDRNHPTDGDNNQPADEQPPGRHQSEWPADMKSEPVADFASESVADIIGIRTVRRVRC